MGVASAAITATVLTPHLSQQQSISPPGLNSRPLVWIQSSHLAPYHRSRLLFHWDGRGERDRRKKSPSCVPVWSIQSFHEMSMSLTMFRLFTHISKWTLNPETFKEIAKLFLVVHQTPSDLTCRWISHGPRLFSLCYSGSDCRLSTPHTVAVVPAFKADGENRHTANFLQSFHLMREFVETLGEFESPPLANYQSLLHIHWCIVIMFPSPWRRRRWLSTSERSATSGSTDRKVCGTKKM